MLFILGCVVIALMRWAPQSAVGLGLRRVLADAPLRLIERLGRTNLALMLVLVGIAAALLIWGKAEGAFLGLQTIPEGFAWIAAFDVGTWVDLIVVGWILGFSVRLKTVRVGTGFLIRRLRSVLSRARSRPRARTPQYRRRHTEAKSDNDDGPGWAERFAA